MKSTPRSLSAKTMRGERRILGLLNGGARDLKFLAIELAVSEYDFTKLVERACEEGKHQRLGYLAEVTAEAVKNRRPSRSARLHKLSNALHRDIDRWDYLSPVSDWEKRLWDIRSRSPLNRKWMIRDSIAPSELEEWFALYLERAP